jgi:hypothetical protein
MENLYLYWIFPLRMVIFHCYVSSPEGRFLFLHQIDGNYSSHGVPANSGLRQVGIRASVFRNRKRAPDVPDVPDVPSSCILRRCSVSFVQSWPWFGGCTWGSSYANDHGMITVISCIYPTSKHSKNPEIHASAPFKVSRRVNIDWDRLNMGHTQKWPV